MQKRDFDSVASLIQSAYASMQNVDGTSRFQTVLQSAVPSQNRSDFINWVIRWAYSDHETAYQVTDDAHEAYCQEWNAKNADSLNTAVNSAGKVFRTLQDLSGHFQNYIEKALDDQSATDGFTELSEKYASGGIIGLENTASSSQKEEIQRIKELVAKMFSHPVSNFLLLPFVLAYQEVVAQFMGQTPPDTEYYDVSDYVSYRYRTGEYYLSEQNKKDLQEIFRKSELSDSDYEKLVIICNLMSNEDGSMNTEMMSDFLECIYFKQDFQTEKTDTNWDKASQVLLPGAAGSLVAPTGGIWTTALGLGLTSQVENYRAEYTVTYKTSENYRNFTTRLFNDDQNGVDWRVSTVLDYYVKYGSLKREPVEFKYSLQDTMDYGSLENIARIRYMNDDAGECKVDVSISYDEETGLYTVSNSLTDNRSITNNHTLEIYDKVENIADFDEITYSNISGSLNHLMTKIGNDFDMLKLSEDFDLWDNVIPGGIFTVLGWIPGVGLVVDGASTAYDVYDTFQGIDENKEFNQYIDSLKDENQQKYMRIRGYEAAKTGYDMNGIIGDVIIVKDKDGIVSEMDVRNQHVDENFSVSEKYSQYLNDNHLESDFLPSSWDELSEDELEKIFKWEYAN